MNFLDGRVDKQVTTDTLPKLIGLVLKSNIFELTDKTYKLIRGTTTGAKLAPPYAILFIAALEKKIFSKVKSKLSVWWRYIDYIFFVGGHGKELLETFINEINSVHPPIKFTADWSNENVNILVIEVALQNGIL